jgi:Type I phosphodiesterase / nucleotide pyrophosphatase
LERVYLCENNYEKKISFVWITATIKLCPCRRKAIRDNGTKAESMQSVFPSKTFPNHYSLATGAYSCTHGYDPAVQNMRGIFYAMGPNLKSNYKIDTFENINVYPLICELLQFEPYKDAPDAPDGKLEVREKILVKYKNSQIGKFYLTCN